MEHTQFPEAMELAAGVISQWHEHLTNVTIAYLSVEEMKTRNVETWAKIRKASPVEQALSPGTDLILVVNETVWGELSKAQRIALLDHEFCHAAWDSEKGEIKMAHHDLEEFNTVVRRHGYWRESIKLFGEQLELFEGEPSFSVSKGLGKPAVSLPHAGNVQ